MNKNYTAADAIAAAVKYASITHETVYSPSAKYEDGYYHVVFYTDWTMYECYVDAATLDVPGFNHEPCLQPPTEYAASPAVSVYNRKASIASRLASLFRGKQATLSRLRAA